MQNLPANAFRDGPFNPWTNEGDSEDTAYYIRQPGAAFLRPWISVPGGIAFVWPLGVEGFSLSVEPALGIHRYIGDNNVKVDVMHLGEERITLSGSFPGVSAPDAMQALYNVVKADTPQQGKLLYIPHALDYSRRVTVASARFDRSQDMRGLDLTYDLEFVVTDLGVKNNDPQLTSDDVILPPGSGAPTSMGTTSRRFQVTSKYNTLRKIAAFKKTTWSAIYAKNEAYFRKIGIAKFKAPDFHLKLGVNLYY